MLRPYFQFHCLQLKQFCRIGISVRVNFYAMRLTMQSTTGAYLAGTHAALEQLFRARVIAFLAEA